MIITRGINNIPHFNYIPQDLTKYPSTIRKPNTIASFQAIPKMNLMKFHINFECQYITAITRKNMNRPTKKVIV